MANDGVSSAPVQLLSDDEVGEKFGCAAGPKAACGNYLACARLQEAIANGFNEKSGADAGNEQPVISEERTHNGKMG